MVAERTMPIERIQLVDEEEQTEIAVPSPSISASSSSNGKGILGTVRTEQTTQVHTWHAVCFFRPIN